MFPQQVKNGWETKGFCCPDHRPTKEAWVRVEGYLRIGYEVLKKGWIPLEDNTRKWGFVGGALFLEIRKRNVNLWSNKDCKGIREAKG